MKEVLSQKIFWISLIFLLLLAMGTALFLRWYGADKKSQEAPMNNANNSIQINGESNQVDVSGNTVTYSDSGFDKKELTIKDKVGLGCVVKVVNSSTNPLKIGLSPHKEPADPGPMFDPIPTGKSLLFDPRFSGYTQLSYHNHENPSEEFLVKFDPSCQRGVK